MSAGKKQWLLIGTYTEPILFGTGELVQGKGKGIHLYSFDKETGRFAEEGAFEKIPNPSYLCVSKDSRFVYAVNELKEYEGAISGAASAFAVEWNGDRPSLRFLNTQATQGTDPCHISVDSQGRAVFAANFSSGSVAMFQVREDGSLSPATAFVQHKGRGKDPKRQAGPHAHAVVLTPDEGLLLAPELGIDRLMVYRPDFAAGALREALPVEMDPGDGPRYVEFHPNGRFCYVINELGSSISLLHYDAAEGTFAFQQKTSTIPQGFEGSNISADLHLTEDGRYLYASNRGDNTIAAFAVQQETGELTPITRFSCGGKTPRNFCVLGSYLLVANQDSDNLLSFHIDGETGEATLVHEIAAPMPVCVKPLVF